MRTRTFVVAGLLAALVLAGVASFYASSHPDGLEYVADKTGFLDTADDSSAADGIAGVGCCAEVADGGAADGRTGAGETLARPSDSAALSGNSTRLDTPFSESNT